MVARWLSGRVVARAAVGGLALGLAALAVLTVAGTASTRQATARVRAYNQVSDAWSTVFVQVAQEDEALHRYLDTGTDTDRRALLAITGAAEPPLVWIAVNGGADEAFQVRVLRQDYAGYEKTVRGVVLAGARGDAAGVEAYVAPAALEFAELRRQVVANVQRKQRDLAGYLAVVDARDRALESVAGGVLVVDMGLLVLCTALLIGYQRRVERQAAASRHQALHDPLTGLANRVLLGDRTAQALRLATRSGEAVGLLVVDLDGFKQVNDSLGHAGGDVLLRAVACRLTAAVRDSDTVARLGGDEFAVLLPNVGSSASAHEVADRVLRAIRQPVELPDGTATVDASIGLALYPVQGADADQLFRYADEAMYAAKRRGLGVCVYPPPGYRATTGAERSTSPISLAGSASP
ncbi:MAG TPA: GGDEF domain-containing protein [Rugosimonospora sp.]|nr:GGDEF domain-containing protein [Rugosimonospora sp.]